MVNDFQVEMMIRTVDGMMHSLIYIPCLSPGSCKFQPLDLHKSVLCKSTGII